MAGLKESALLIEGEEVNTTVEDLVQHSEDEEDLTQVDADLSDLMGREKPEATLRFGTSLVSRNLINFYVDKGYFKAGECRPSKNEDTPKPLEGETVVFRNFSLLGCAFRLIPLSLRSWTDLMLRCIISHRMQSFSCRSFSRL